MVTWHRALLVLAIFLASISVSLAMEIDSIGAVRLDTMITPWDNHTNITSISFLDNTQYLCLLIDGYGLAIIDWQEKRRPRLIGNCLISEDVINFAFINGYASIPYGEYPFNEKSDKAGLLILDLSNPQKPELVTRYPTSIASSYIYADNNYALLMGAGDTTDVLDISSPETPRLVSRIPLVSSILDIYRKDNYLLMLSRQVGIRVYDFSNILEPKFISSFTCDSWTETFEIAGDYAYNWAHGEKLEIYDLSDPYEIKFVSEYIISEYLRANSDSNVYWRHIEDLDVSGNKVLLLETEKGTGLNDFKNYLYIIDVANPYQPCLDAKLDLPALNFNIAVSSDNIFLYSASDILWMRLVE